MTEDKTEQVGTGECGACRAVIPLDSDRCPECNVSFSGVSDEALGECGACHGLVPLDSTKCMHCGTVFIADDVVDVLRNWLATTGITIPTLFKKFDADGDGQIDSSELKTGLLSLNLADLPPSQVERLIETIDADGDGRIDLDELHTTITGDVSEKEEKETPPAAEATSEEPESEAVEEDEDVVAETEEGNESEEADESEHDDAEEDAQDSEDSEDEGDTQHGDVEDLEEEDTEEDGMEDSEEEKLEDEASSVDEAQEDEASEPEDDETLDDSGKESLIQRIADAMDEQETSATRFFNSLDRDANGNVDILELMNELTMLLDDEVTHDDIEEFLHDVDDDGDRSVDMIEFITALEALEDAEEVIDEGARIDKIKPEKPFPTPLQKKMMGKQWNDIFWPLIHLAFGLFIAAWVLNGFGGVGPLSVDGTGGPVELETKGTLLPPAGLTDGDIYPCDPTIQVGDCKNSLTPFAGESSSMPAGFYWDGILFMLLGTAGLIGSLYAHLLLMPTWRARAKAMKEVQDDKEDAADESAGESQPDAETEEGDEEGLDEDLEEEMDEALEEDFEDENLGDADEEEDGDGEDSIDIGSHIGLVLEDEEVFGKIIEFDDDDETVTIEEDETGDIITGYQEDMFLE